MVSLFLSKETDDEAIKVHGRTDHWYFEGAPAGPVAKDLCRKHGVSDATFYKWGARFGGMEVSDAKKLKALEAGNAKLKKLLAEQMMDVSTLKEMLGKNC